MADQQHLECLKQGVETWNTWRKQFPTIQPKLSLADLSEARLSREYLSRANLSHADLSYANLSRAHLSRANLRSADLTRTNFSHVITGWTNFDDLDLRTVKGLETIVHQGPSTIGIDTILRSEGDIPEVFLREAGVSETFIEYIHALSQKPIQYYTCFISYSSQDQEFAERLYADLQSKGVRCWYAPEDMKTGDKIRQRIDESIRLYDKLLLVLSQHSIYSQWVEFEAEAAMDKESKNGKTVLFPILLDDTVMSSTTSWVAHLHRTRHITNFTNWKQHDDYQKALSRLLRDLKAQ